MKTFKKMRENKKLTIKQASNLLGITDEYLRMIERGVRKPGDELKVKMSILYQTTISDIFLALKETKCFKE